MNIKYDPKADAAYIQLGDTVKPVTETVPCENLPVNVRGEIMLDFDRDGILQGIEILQASSTLPKESLQS